ncbi:hypothetical protein IPJ70_02640 [Candidatus Campbellbacteria bacterium]|nr:MAG: hypothetical protein IPJ70_02640 [Candidatus Campbellbacteria bacterium]
MLGRLIEWIMRVPKEYLGTLMTLAEKLAGSEGVRVIEELKKFNRGELCGVKAVKVFTVWKTIRIGDHLGVKGYLDALGVADRSVYDGAEDIHLVRVTPRSVGFTKSPRFDMFIVRILKLGLEPCPTEVGSALRLAYDDQPKGESIRVATKSIIISMGASFVHIVELVGDGLGHVDSWYSPSKELNLDDEWVLRYRK